MSMEPLKVPAYFSLIVWWPTFVSPNPFLVQKFSSVGSSNTCHLFTEFFPTDLLSKQDRQCKSTPPDAFPVLAVFKSSDTSAKQVTKHTRLPQAPPALSDAHLPWIPSQLHTLLGTGPETFVGKPHPAWGTRPHRPRVHGLKNMKRRKGLISAHHPGAAQNSLKRLQNYASNCREANTAVVTTEIKKGSLHSMATMQLLTRARLLLQRARSFPLAPSPSRLVLGSGTVWKGWIRRLRS